MTGVQTCALPIWIDPVAPMQTMRAEKSDGGMLRQFIPARLEDNPTLTANDPDYVDRLSGLGSVDLVRAMRAADWNKIGRASCRERVCKYVSISVVAVSLKKKKTYS